MNGESIRWNANWSWLHKLASRRSFKDTGGMHAPFIRRCLELAERSRGKTGINPMVGAVLVRDGNIIAEGFHKEFGKAHAERQLLENIEYKICSTDVLYVNLEPCCHTDKKTPPCAQSLVEKGIRNVVYGMLDPNPEVSGKGIALLKKAGVVVVGPVLEDQCLRLNRGFVSLHTLGRPWITLKMARTVDGRIANQDGSPMKITTAEQDAWSHQFLRAKHDAILVGVNTIITDDPRLTVTLTPDPSPRLRGGETQDLRYRIIPDPHLKIPLEANVVNSPLADRTMILRKETKETKESEETREKSALLQKRGVRLVVVPYEKNAFEWKALWQVLITPDGDYHGITSILVEGGSKTWEAFREAGCVDQEIVLVGTAREK